MNMEEGYKNIKDGEPTAAQPVQQRPVGSGTSKAMLGVVIALVFGGAAFYGGMQYQKSQAGTSLTSSQQGGPGGMMGQSGQNRGAMGTVTAVSSTSITIKDQMQGSTKTYTISDSTTVTDNGSTAAVSDIQSGDQVMISVSSSDSSAAQTIALNPTMPSGGPGGMQSQSGTSSSTTTQTN